MKQNGNILFYILVGILLVGALTVAIRNTGGGMDNIDREDFILKSTQVQRYGQQLSLAVADLVSNGVSETALRFAHPSASTDYGTITSTPTAQVFSSSGGKVTYRSAPALVNDGSAWEFYATSRIPQVGSDKTELIAVLPHVTQSFCEVINKQLGFTSGTQPTDNATGSTPDCVQGSSTDRFTGTYKDASPNVLDSTSFSKLPSLQGCVACSSDGTYNYYYVLLTR